MAEKNGKKREPQSLADLLEDEARRQGVTLPKDILKRARTAADHDR